METETMGRVLAEATIENLEDLWAVDREFDSRGERRRIVVSDGALVDSGATLLSFRQTYSATRAEEVQRPSHHEQRRASGSRDLRGRAAANDSKPHMHDGCSGSARLWSPC